MIDNERIAELKNYAINYPGSFYKAIKGEDVLGLIARVEAGEAHYQRFVQSAIARGNAGKVDMSEPGPAPAACSECGGGYDDTFRTGPVSAHTRYVPHKAGCMNGLRPAPAVQACVQAGLTECAGTCATDGCPRFGRGPAPAVPHPADDEGALGEVSPVLEAFRQRNDAARAVPHPGPLSERCLICQPLPGNPAMCKNGGYCCKYGCGDCNYTFPALSVAAVPHPETRTTCGRTDAHDAHETSGDRYVWCTGALRSTSPQHDAPDFDAWWKSQRVFDERGRWCAEFGWNAALGSHPVHHDALTDEMIDDEVGRHWLGDAILTPALENRIRGRAIAKWARDHAPHVCKPPFQGALERCMVCQKPQAAVHHDADALADRVQGLLIDCALDSDSEEAQVIRDAAAAIRSKPVGHDADALAEELHEWLDGLTDLRVSVPRTLLVQIEERLRSKADSTDALQVLYDGAMRWFMANAMTPATAAGFAWPSHVSAISDESLATLRDLLQRIRGSKADSSDALGNDRLALRLEHSATIAEFQPIRPWLEQAAAALRSQADALAITDDMVIEACKAWHRSAHRMFDSNSGEENRMHDALEAALTLAKYYPKPALAEPRRGCICEREKIGPNEPHARNCPAATVCEDHSAHRQDCRCPEPALADNAPTEAKP